MRAVKRPVRLALALYALVVIVPSWASAQTSTITCDPVGTKRIDGKYEVYGKGNYTYTSGGTGWVFYKIEDEYGIVDKKGQFKKSDFNGGPFGATVDTTKKTWKQDTVVSIGEKGASIWIRARLWEVHMMQGNPRVVAEVISKYTAPNE